MLLYRLNGFSIRSERESCSACGFASLNRGGQMKSLGSLCSHSSFSFTGLANKFAAANEKALQTSFERLFPL